MADHETLKKRVQELTEREWDRPGIECWLTLRMNYLNMEHYKLL